MDAMKNLNEEFPEFFTSKWRLKLDRVHQAFGQREMEAKHSIYLKQLKVKCPLHLNLDNVDATAKSINKSFAASRDLEEHKKFTFLLNNRPQMVDGAEDEIVQSITDLEDKATLETPEHSAFRDLQTQHPEIFSGPLWSVCARIGKVIETADRYGAETEPQLHPEGVKNAKDQDQKDQIAGMTSLQNALTDLRKFNSDFEALTTEGLVSRVIVDYKKWSRQSNALTRMREEFPDIFVSDAEMAHEKIRVLVESWKGEPKQLEFVEELLYKCRAIVKVNDLNGTVRRIIEGAGAVRTLASLTEEEKSSKVRVKVLNHQKNELLRYMYEYMGFIPTSFERWGTNPFPSAGDEPRRTELAPRASTSVEHSDNDDVTETERIMMNNAMEQSRRDAEQLARNRANGGDSSR